MRVPGKNKKYQTSCDFILPGTVPLDEADLVAGKALRTKDNYSMRVDGLGMADSIMWRGDKDRLDLKPKLRRCGSPRPKSRR